MEFKLTRKGASQLPAVICAQPRVGAAGTGRGQGLRPAPARPEPA